MLHLAGFYFGEDAKLIFLPMLAFSSLTQGTYYLLTTWNIFFIDL